MFLTDIYAQRLLRFVNIYRRVLRNICVIRNIYINKNLFSFSFFTFVVLSWIRISTNDYNFENLINLKLYFSTTIQFPAHIHSLFQQATDIFYFMLIYCYVMSFVYIFYIFEVVLKYLVKISSKFTLNARYLEYPELVRF